MCVKPVFIKQDVKRDLCIGFSIVVASVADVF